MAYRAHRAQKWELAQINPALVRPTFVARRAFGSRNATESTVAARFLRARRKSLRGSWSGRDTPAYPAREILKAGSSTETLFLPLCLALYSAWSARLMTAEKDGSSALAWVTNC